MKTINDKIKTSSEIISKAIDKYDRIGVFSSFGKDSMVVLHLAMQIDPYIPVYTIMTPFKPKETFEYKDMITKLWKLNLNEFKSNVAVSMGLSNTDPNECCRILKVEPTKIALKELDAWITGLRKTEGETRGNYQEIEVSDSIVKVNPILEWEEIDIWKYMAINKIPVHPWYAEGYRSLGCYPCTSKVDDEDLERSGRWKNTDKCGGECGIHTMEDK